LRKGNPSQLPPPIHDFEDTLSSADQQLLAQSSACSAVGSKETVTRGLVEFSQQTSADELMIASQIHDHRARLRSFELVAELRDELASAQ
jgi:alkanesulfonate monooxygenase SsuD/methylene tetrahydromethanopterin reductase-like flavin-dependent oxidoreductase (luciferase family)